MRQHRHAEQCAAGRCLGVLAALWLAGSVLAAPASPEPALAACLAENDPPRSVHSTAGASGLDVDVARLAAARLQRPLRLVWLPEQPQTDIESTDLNFRPLLRGECDVQLSVPGQDAIARYRQRLALTGPYYAAAYELLPADATLRWGAPYAGTVAVRANTVAHVAIDAAGLRWTMQRSTADILAALRQGEATAALIWGPDLATSRTPRSPDFVPPAALRWNLHAATRRDHPLHGALDQLFGEAATQQAILALLERHGLPPRAPFASVHSLSALRDAGQR